MIHNVMLFLTPTPYVDKGKVAFVIGNSPQINELSKEEKEYLDHADAVFTLNDFVGYWRVAGFRPTHWQAVAHWHPNFLAKWLTWIASDEMLRCRLRTLFLGIRNISNADFMDNGTFPEVHQQAVKVIKHFRPLFDKCGIQIVEITLAGDGITEQVKKCYWNETMWSPVWWKTSTITALVNIVHRCYPSREIRLIGCQVGGIDEGYFFHPGYFFNSGEAKKPLNSLSMSWWEGLCILRSRGVPLIDCNLRHGCAIPDTLPRKKLLEGL